MWLVTRHGFYSVTRSRIEPKKLQIRARTRQDLLNLADFMSTVESLGSGKAIADELRGGIIETPDADYRYRCIVTPADWAIISIELMTDITYSNFKNEIKDPTRHNAYLEIWGIMQRFQPMSWENRPPNVFTGQRLGAWHDPYEDDDPVELDTLSELEKHIILTSIKMNGSYNACDTIAFEIESFTPESYERASGFLDWVVENGRKFGHGNIDEVYQEYVESSSQTQKGGGGSLPGPETAQFFWE